MCVDTTILYWWRSCFNNSSKYYHGWKLPTLKQIKKQRKLIFHAVWINARSHRIYNKFMASTLPLTVSFFVFLFFTSFPQFSSEFPKLIIQLSGEWASIWNPKRKSTKENRENFFFWFADVTKYENTFFFQRHEIIKRFWMDQSCLLFSTIHKILSANNPIQSVKSLRDRWVYRHRFGLETCNNFICSMRIK